MKKVTTNRNTAASCGRVTRAAFAGYAPQSSSTELSSFTLSQSASSGIKCGL